MPGLSAHLASLFLVLAALPLTFSAPTGHWVRLGHMVLFTPRLEQGDGGCYAVELKPSRDQSLAPEAPHVQPVPRWKWW